MNIAAAAQRLGPVVSSDQQCVDYVAAQIRADISFVDLNRALLEHGFALRVHSGHGLVIEHVDHHQTQRGPG